MKLDYLQDLVVYDIWINNNLPHISCLHINLHYLHLILQYHEGRLVRRHGSVRHLD